LAPTEKTASETKKEELAVGAWKEVATWEPENESSAFRFGGRAVTGWSRFWTIGDRAILDRRMLGIFCSSRCPGDVILHAYDLARGLRDAEVPVIGGFHSPMEQECLEILLRGRQPVVVCPARGIESMRIPTAWRKPIDEGRLVLLSPFPASYRRPTMPLAEQRNQLVADVAQVVFVVHAAPESKTAVFCRRLGEKGKPVWTFDGMTNAIASSPTVRSFQSVTDVIQDLKLTGGSLV